MYCCFGNHQEISELLLNHKQIQITRSLSCDYQMSQSIVIGNSDVQSYTIIINYNSTQQSNQLYNKIQRLNQMIIDLKSCDHKNTFKYFDSFLIDNYHFILLESVDKSLYDLAQELQDSDQFDELYFNIAIQLLEGINYLHSKNLLLNIPALKNIYIDQNMNVKFLNYEQSKQSLENTQSSKVLSYFAQYKFPFIPPEDFINESDKQEVHYKENLTVDGNIWSICMCLFELAGANYFQQKQFALGIEPYKIQKKVHYRINLILSQVMQREKEKRLKSDKLIVIFQEAQKGYHSTYQIQETESEQVLFSSLQKDFDDQKFHEALKVLFELLQNNLNNNKYLAWIGRCHCAIGKLDESEYWSNQCLNQNPKNDVAYFNLGNVWKLRKQPQKAIELFQKSIESNPKNTYSLNNLGLMYDSLQMEDQAQEMYKKAIEIQPDKPFLYYNIGRSYYLINNNEQAKKWFEKSLEIDPTYFKSLTYLGEIEFNNNNDIIAMDYFKKSLKISANETTYFSLGTQYYKIGKQAYSLECFKKSHQKSLKTHGLYYILASTNYCKKIYDKSIKYYKKALQLKPDDLNDLTYMKLSKKFI